MKLSNPIEQFFRSEGNKISKYSELFKGNDDFIDQMTELSHDEVRGCMVLLTNDEFLRAQKIRPIYGGIVQKFMRLQVSKDRKSRGEYVSVHKGEEERELSSAQKGYFGGSGRI